MPLPCEPSRACLTSLASRQGLPMPLPCEPSRACLTSLASRRGLPNATALRTARRRVVSPTFSPANGMPIAPVEAAVVDPLFPSYTPRVAPSPLQNRREVLTWLAAAGCAPLLAPTGCAPVATSCPKPPAPPAPPALPPGLVDQELRLLASPGTELPIVQRVPGGTNVLRRLARELRASDDVTVLEKRMRATLEISKGVGIAAPQVGIGARAILVMIGARTEAPHVEWFVNPRIVERSDEVTLDYEGCLSINDVCGMVRRHRRVTVEFGIAGSPLKHVEVSGFDARIFQHEIDHLDGVLYVDRVEGGLQPKERLKELRDQLRRDHPELAAHAGKSQMTAVL